MKTSKYLERFLFPPEVKSEFKLIGDGLLVEKIAIEERRTTSGLIVRTGQGERMRDTMSTDVPTFVYVLAVGEGFYDDETGEPVDVEVKPGDIILVGNHAVRWFSDMDIPDYQPYEIGLTREQEARLIFKGQEGYEQFFRFLDPKTKTLLDQTSSRAPDETS